MERINIYVAQSATAAALKLSDCLTAHAVPKYFDNVELVEETTSKSTVTCYVGDLEFITFVVERNAAGYTSIKLNIKTIAGETTSILTRSTERGPYCGFTYCYVCEGGLCFSLDKTGPALLSITKDNAGNTVLLCGTYPVNNTEQLNVHLYTTSDDDGATKLYAISSGAPAIVYHERRVVGHDGLLTVICPIPVADTQYYTPDAYYLPFTQYTAHGFISIDGVVYLSNGLWCVRS